MKNYINFRPTKNFEPLWAVKVKIKSLPKRNLNCSPNNLQNKVV